MIRMKLCIVTINYNNAEGLRKTLASVAAQTYRDIEHIIVDAASTDGSVEIIKEYEEKIHLTHSTIHIVWTSEKDKGIYDAMNKGIRKATGDYVWILNSGDCAASSDVVERMMNILPSFTPSTLNDKIDIPILIGNKIHVYPGDKRVYSPLPIGRSKTPNPIPIETSMLTFYRGTIPQDAAFVRRDLFEKYGGFDEGMKICADWKLYLNMIALDGIIPMYVNIDVVLFDMTGVSNANNELRLAERRAYLKQVLPASVLKDYDTYAFSIEQYKRLQKHHLWGIVNFLERVLFKLEKWNILKK